MGREKVCERTGHSYHHTFRFGAAIHAPKHLQQQCFSLASRNLTEPIMEYVLVACRRHITLDISHFGPFTLCIWCLFCVLFFLFLGFCFFSLCVCVCVCVCVCKRGLCRRRRKAVPYQNLLLFTSPTSEAQLKAVSAVMPGMQALGEACSVNLKRGSN